jgi:D-glycero-alpha-D-manno-heptose-7-phosphate kinase
MDVLVARAPTRIDFGGGWTDVPPYSDEQGGFVCNVAIDRHAMVTLRPREEGRDDGTLADADRALIDAAVSHTAADDVDVGLQTRVPIGAGLGGSSACGVALLGALAAWQGRDISGAELAEESRRLEVEHLGIAGGRQDHYAAALGGALALEFQGDTRVKRIEMAGDLRATLERRCVIAYTGQSRISGDTITAVLDAYDRREQRVLDALDRMKALAREMARAIVARDIDELGALVGEHWIHQRALHPAIPTPLIDGILAFAGRAGALGGKALGASGGGCVLVVAPEERVDHIRSVVGGMATLLDFRVDSAGFRIEMRAP